VGARIGFGGPKMTLPRPWGTIPWAPAPLKPFAAEPPNTGALQSGRADPKSLFAKRFQRSQLISSNPLRS